MRVPREKYVHTSPLKRIRIHGIRFTHTNEKATPEFSAFGCLCSNLFSRPLLQLVSVLCVDPDFVGHDSTA